MQNKIKNLPGWLKCTLPCFLLLFILGLAIQLVSMDGFRGTILSCIFQDTTVYAPGYSENKYAKINNGMPEEDVDSLLGTPLEVDVWKGIKRYHYTRSNSGSHYRIRQIHIQAGQVIGKKHYYFVD